MARKKTRATRFAYEPDYAVPPGGTVSAFSQTLNPLKDTFTFTGPAVTLPTSPSTYFLGVVVDPYGKIAQLSLPANPLATSVPPLPDATWTRGPTASRTQW